MVRTQSLLFASLLLGCAAFYQPVDYDNSKSRLLLLGAIVDEGRLAIDSHQQYTIDKSFYGGHYYSFKPIGLPFLAAPVYWLLRKAVLGPVEQLADPTIIADPEAKYLVRFFTVSVPFALLGLILFRFLLEFGIAPRKALWTCLAYGFGTIALLHATIFSGHETAAFFLFASFATLYRLQHGPEPGARGAAWSALAGFCAALATLCDYMAAVYAAILSLYLATSGLGRGAKLAFFAGALPGAALLAWYDLTCFGSIASTGYSHLAFAPFRAYTERGLFGVGVPDPARLLALSGSAARGLFFVSPVLALALPGLAFLWRRPARRREFAVLAAIPACAFLIYSAYPGWHGGWTFGPRYLTAVLPFLAVPLALAADAHLWFLVPLGVSVFQIGCAQLGYPHAPEDIRNPIVEFLLPLLRQGCAAQAPASGLLVYALAAALAAAAFAGLPRHRPRPLPVRWRILSALWCVYVALALAFVRTPGEAAAGARAVALRDYSSAVSLPRISETSPSLPGPSTEEPYQLSNKPDVLAK